MEAEALLAQIHQDLLREVDRRLFEENFPRLRKCLGELTKTDVWYRPNMHSNSVGNLTLHLIGNCRQWITSGLGGQPDKRDRQQEFDEQGPIATDELLQKLDDLEVELKEVLENVPLEELVRKRPVQTFEESGIGILVHVVEHFSYHVGQITYFVKSRKNMDMGYYKNIDLEEKSSV